MNNKIKIKQMKKIINFLVVFSLVFFYSCDPKNSDYDTDDVTAGELLGGAILDVRNDSEGKLLGVPSSQDFETATVAFAETILDLEIFLLSGGQDVASYEITKALNGGSEVTVATSATLPINLNYASADEFVNGLGVSLDDLRIGDVISFRTKMIHNDGRVSYSGPNDGSYSVTVSCSSDLAAMYNLTLVRDDGASWNRPTEVIFETGVGEYQTTTTGGWAPGAYSATQGYTFTDICGALTVASQQLFQGMFSNEVVGTESGSVDGVTGNLSVTYQIDFSAGPSVYTGTYVKL